MVFIVQEKNFGSQIVLLKCKLVVPNQYDLLFTIVILKNFLEKMYCNDKMFQDDNENAL